MIKHLKNIYRRNRLLSFLMNNSGRQTPLSAPSQKYVGGSLFAVTDPRLPLLGIMLLIIISGLACGEQPETKATDSPDTTVIAIERPDQQIRNAKISLYDGPHRTTDIEADYIEKYEKQDSTLAWNLNVNFYDSLGRVMSNLTADSGLVREEMKLMETFGHVRVTTEDSAILLTEQLAYDVADDKITSDEFVKIIQRGDTIQGYGLETDQRLKNIKIKKQVTGTLQSTDGVVE